MTLTSRQAELLDLIERYLIERGYAPIFSEVIAETSITTTSLVAYHLERLVEKGYIERGPGPRAIRLLRGSDGVRRELRIVRLED